MNRFMVQAFQDPPFCRSTEETLSTALTLFFTRLLVLLVSQYLAVLQKQNIAMQELLKEGVVFASKYIMFMLLCDTIKRHYCKNTRYSTRHGNHYIPFYVEKY
jgi:hypothetical protein